MKIAKHIGTLSVLTLSMLAAQTASAADEQFVNPEWANSATYIGAGIGRTDTNFKAREILAPLNTPGQTIRGYSADEKDVGYKLYVGKQLNKNFAVELGAFDLGEFSYATNTFQGGTLNANVGYRGVFVDLVGQLALTERFSVMARAGMNYARAKTEFTGSRVGSFALLNEREKRLNPKVGLGLEYKLTEALAVRADAERYRLDDAIRNNGHVNMYSLNLVYKLGRPAAKPVVYTPPPAPAPVVEAPAPAPAPVQAAPVPTSEKVSFAAEALFDFDKSVVKADGKAALDDLLMKLQGMNTEVMITVGHTDSVGSDAYNQKLSLRRAEAVKAYIITKGVEASRVYTEGKGESQPVADNKTAEGRAKNRRVTVEVVGTRTVNK